MNERFITILNNLITGRDNKTHDYMRLLTIIGFMVFIVLEIREVWMNSKFAEEEYARALMYMLGGSGLGIFLKKDDEPDKM